MNRLKLAPIGLSAYARLAHLRATVSSLKSNDLARESELFVFSDGPAPGHEPQVREVRNFLRTIRGFRSVTLVERETNNRVFNNRSGMRQLLDDYGRLIWLEEDIVTAPSFLRFMNEALDSYAHDPKVISICGYRPPIAIPRDYPWDAFAIRRFSAWGFGIWRDRFDSLRLKLEPGDYDSVIRNWSRLRDFTSAGWDMVPLLRRDAYGDLDALDVKVMLQQFWANQYTVYPRHYLVLNKGHDGTGMHCVKSNRYDVPIDSGRHSNFNFPEEVTLDDRIARHYCQFRSRSIWFRLIVLAQIARDRLTSARRRTAPAVDL